MLLPRQWGNGTPRIGRTITSVRGWGRGALCAKRLDSPGEPRREKSAPSPTCQPGLAPRADVDLSRLGGILMMHHGLRIALAAVMLWTGIPHALCPCGHASAAVRRTAPPACPHCRPNHARPPSGHEKPCQCGACEVIQAVPPGEAVAVVAPALNAWDGPPAVDTPTLLPPLVSASEEGWAAHPPGSATGAGRVLPIFLGHLLL